MTVETFGNITLIHGDCRSVSLPVFDAVVADPVYGNGFDVAKNRSRWNSGLGWSQSHDLDPDWDPMPDDSFDPRWWLDPECSQMILWGANHYSHHLPSASCWLVWDKRRDTTSDDFSDCELAWTNLGGPVRKFSHLWRGLCREGEENISRQRKLHPWQKPVALMAWCVGMTDGVVLDPYMGSASTGVACLRLGRPYVGVEISERYFQVACERIEQESRQMSLLA